MSPCKKDHTVCLGLCCSPFFCWRLPKRRLLGLLYNKEPEMWAVSGRYLQFYLDPCDCSHESLPSLKSAPWIPASLPTGAASCSANSPHISIQLKLNNCNDNFLPLRLLQCIHTSLGLQISNQYQFLGSKMHQ